MFSLFLVGVLLDLCMGHNTFFEGYDLSRSSYHLCTGHETTVVSRVLSYQTSYIDRRLCGGWLSWKSCKVTLYKMAYRTEYMNVTKEVLRCCDGYEEVGYYCALPLNRAQEFTAKPGSCPGVVVESPRNTQCKWDSDCPGWQKCCQREGPSLCTDPEPTGIRGWCFNITVTVKTEYERLISMDGGILNHTRLLHSVMTGALDSTAVNVYYINSWSVGPFRTASSLLIGSPEVLSGSNTTTKLLFLIKNIEEITSVTVEDIDECAHMALSSCSRQADCANTEGSYSCTCPHGFTDLNPNNTGVHCQAGDPLTSARPSNATNLFQWTNATGLPPYSTNYPSWFPSYANTSTGVATTTGRAMTLSSTHTPASNHDLSAAGSNKSDTSTAISWRGPTSVHTTNTDTPTMHLSTSVSSEPAWHTLSQQTNATSQTGIGPAEEDMGLSSPSECHPTLITNLQVSNITGSSFCLSWTAQSQSGLSFLVTLMEGSEFRGAWETELSVWVVTGLQPGGLYNVTVTPTACGRQATSLHLLAKTDAQTLQANACLTNVEFTNALLFPSSQEYQNLSRSILEEILQSLPDEILALVNSGDVRVLITGLAPGSVVVNLTVILTPRQFYEILNVTSALMQALENSSTYTVDLNKTSIHDVNECSTANMDCSPWALCINTWGSYSCVCLDGYIDLNPSWPGRACSVLSNTTPEQTATTPAITTATINNPATSKNTAATRLDPPVTTNNPGSTSTQIKMITLNPGPKASDVPTAETTTVSAGLATSLQRSTSPFLVHLVTYARAISVMCKVRSITVMVSRGFLQARHIRDSSLYLGREGCGLNAGTSSHVQLTVAWDDCDTQLSHNNTHYTAKTTLFNSMDPQSLANGTTRVPAVELNVPITCTFERSILISTGYIPTEYDAINDAVMGSGTFHVTFQLLRGTSPLPQNYSLSPEDEVVVEVSVDSTVDRMKVIINKCWATESNNSLELITYVFLENSCPVLNTHTTVLENGNSSKSRLSLRIFSYINLNVVYLHCRIQICIETGLVNCQPKCTERAQRLSNVIGIEKASCGPFFRSHQVSIQERDKTLYLVGYSLLGIGLFLLFIGGLSSLFLYHRKRIRKYNLSLKPKQDNFTYHVFDT
ncbi:uromodulin-like 1 isoform X2 [Esox lucius]|uniref:uromodulin-like 1 isoform X2 n=1 Tax=Esox lucius TaxID=8010 RepID=UPI001476CAE5|nr:uromodulin-like 1 isoform X2 [Esox lucius]